MVCRFWVGSWVSLVLVASTMAGDAPREVRVGMDALNPGVMTIEAGGERALLRSTRFATNFVHEQNRKKRWTELVNEIGVGYDHALPTSATMALKTRHQAESVTKVRNEIGILTVSGDAGEALPGLLDDADVRYAYPVLFDLGQNTRIIVTDRLIVCAETDDAGMAVIAARYDAEPLRRIRNSTCEWVLQLKHPDRDYPLDVVEQMADDPDIEWAQADMIPQLQKLAVLNDPLISNQWHLNSTGQVIGGIAPLVTSDMDVTQAWDIAPGASNMLISVLDSGLDEDHPEFAGKVDSRKWDFILGTNETVPIDPEDNHGTACAGLAAAAGNNGVGVAGVAYGASILPIKMFLGSFSTSDSETADAIRYAADYAQVLSMSWGQLYAPSGPSIESACRYARQSGFGGQGAVLVAAAGNSAGYYEISITNIPSGVNTCRWVYVKDSSVSKGDDACWLDSVTWPAGMGTENFDSLLPPELPSGWSTGMTGSWSSVKADHLHPAQSGTNLLRSGVMGHGTRSYVECVKTFPSSGTLTYFMWANSQDDLSDAWQDYAAFEHPVFGEMYHLAGTVQYPAKFESVMTIGASGSSSVKADYSQYGPEVDVVAPSWGGTNGTLFVETTDRRSTDGYNTTFGDGGDYCKADDETSGFSGTSASTPEIAGLAALVRSVNTNLSPAQIRNIIRASAKKIDTNTVSYTGSYGGGRCDPYGWGLASASGAVARAQSSPDVLDLAADLRIMEMSLFTGDVSFVKIYNTSLTTTQSLSDLALTDNESGDDTSEGTCRFPYGSTIPPRGMALVVFSTNLTTTFLNTVATNAASSNGPAGGLRVYEQTDSGLTYGGLAISNMTVLGNEKVSLATSDNLALVVTEGSDESFLPEVVDGLVFGIPIASGESQFGVGPRTEEGGALQQVAGLQAGQTIQRISTNDSNMTSVDFWIPNATGLSLPPSPEELLYQEGFNDNGYPSGWVTQVVRHVSGAAPTISIDSAGQSPSIVRPYEGVSFVRFNASELTQSTQERFKRRVRLSTVGYSNIVAEFAMYRDPANPELQDSVSIQWSTDQITWQTAGTANRYGSPTGWSNVRITFDQDANNQVTLFIGFLFTGNGGNDVHVDDLNIKATPLHWTLAINSAYSNASPYTGTNVYANNTLIKMSVAQPVQNGENTQFVSRSWFGLGSALSGVGTNFSFRLTTNSIVRWLWATQVWVSASVEDHGVITGSTNGWYRLGSNFAVDVTVETNYHFGSWLGNVPTGQELNSSLSFTVDQTRSLLAQIQPDVMGSVSESWLQSFYGPQSNYVALSETDTDQDGLRAWEEYWAGTDPTDANSRFEIRELSSSTDSNVLTWIGGTGTSGYVVQYSTNLASGWQTVMDGVVRTPPTNTLVLPGSSSGERIFYRVTVTNP